MASDFGSISRKTIVKHVDNFPAGRTTGVSIAALKCLLVFGLRSDFHTRQCQISIDTIAELSGLSRPLVIDGIKHLVSIKLLEKSRQNNNKPAIYKLLEVSKTDFIKIPSTHLYINLRRIPNRGIEYLFALKAYIVLLQVRQRMFSSSNISYEGLSDYYINKKYLSSALSLLVIYKFITIARDYSTSKDDSYIKTSNLYEILHLNTSKTENSIKEITL